MNYSKELSIIRKNIIKSIQNTDVAYYDIAPTENQLITSNKVVKIVSFMSEGYFHSNEGETMMGEINDI